MKESVGLKLFIYKRCGNSINKKGIKSGGSSPLLIPENNRTNFNSKKERMELTYCTGNSLISPAWYTGMVAPDRMVWPSFTVTWVMSGERK